MPVYDTPLHTNDQSLARVLGAGLPVALVLWDSRQGLSDALEDALRQTAKAESGNLLVARLDTADNPETDARWTGARPALVVVSDGNPLTGPVALTSPDVLRVYVDYLLGRADKPAEPGPAAAGARNGAGTAAFKKPVVVTDATFQVEVFDSPVPVVVDFWAPWCGPCRMIGPVLERLAESYDGRLKIAKVNVDEHQQYAAQYGVQGIPTLLIVKNGQVVDRMVGALPEQALRQRIGSYVN
jgi:thioredoxin 1